LLFFTFNFFVHIIQNSEQAIKTSTILKINKNKSVALQALSSDFYRLRSMSASRVAVLVPHAKDRWKLRHQQPS
jgi:hypothetical protein